MSELYLIDTGLPEAICGWSGHIGFEAANSRARSALENFGPSYF